MNGALFHFLLDPGCAIFTTPLPAAVAERVLLLPGEGEYVQAVDAMAAHRVPGAAAPDVPDEVFLHLYAYEVLERMRENVRELSKREGGGSRVLVFPFWPAALFEAAGLVAHGALEIQALFPAPEIVFVKERDPETVAAEARRVLGAVRFDPGAYGRAVRRRIGARGWRLLAGGEGKEP